MTYNLKVPKAYDTLNPALHIWLFMEGKIDTWQNMEVK